MKRVNAASAVSAVLAVVWATGGPARGQMVADNPSNEKVVDAVLAQRRLNPAAKGQQRAELLRLMKAGDDLLAANPGKQGDLRSAVLDRVGARDPAERARLMKVMDDFDRDYIRGLLRQGVYRVNRTGIRFDHRQEEEVVLVQRIEMVTVSEDGKVDLGRPGTGGKEQWVRKGSCRVGELITFEFHRGGLSTVAKVPPNYFDPLGPAALAKVAAVGKLSAMRVVKTGVRVDEAAGQEVILVSTGRAAASAPADGADVSGSTLTVPGGTCQAGDLIVKLIDPPMTEVVKLPKDYFDWVGGDGALFNAETIDPSAPDQPTTFDNAQPKPRVLLRGSVKEDLGRGNLGGFLRDLANHEGRKEWAYLDTKGNVTTAVGHLVGNAQSFAGLGWVNKTTGAPASPQELKAGWDTLQGLRKQGKFGKHFPAKWYGNKVNLTLPDQTVNDIYVNDVRTHVEGVRRILGGDRFNSFPQPAQEAVADMAYNMGPGFLNNGVWPKFVAAINRGDWKAAAGESTRQGIGASRNQWTRNKLLAASSAN